LNLLLYCYLKINSDGQQVAQYQQNKQSPPTLADWTQQRLSGMMLGIQFLVWDRLIMWELGRYLYKFSLYLETFEKQEVLVKMCGSVVESWFVFRINGLW